MYGSRDLDGARDRTSLIVGFPLRDSSYHSPPQNQPRPRLFPYRLREWHFFPFLCSPEFQCFHCLYCSLFLPLKTPSWPFFPFPQTWWTVPPAPSPRTSCYRSRRLATGTRSCDSSPSWWSIKSEKVGFLDKRQKLCLSEKIRLRQPDLTASSPSGREDWRQMHQANCLIVVFPTLLWFEFDNKDFSCGFVLRKLIHNKIKFWLWRFLCGLFIDF